MAPGGGEASILSELNFFEKDVDSCLCFDDVCAGSHGSGAVSMSCNWIVIVCLDGDFLIQGSGVSIVEKVFRVYREDSDGKCDRKHPGRRAADG